MTRLVWPNGAVLCVCRAQAAPHLHPFVYVDYSISTIHDNSRNRFQAVALYTLYELSQNNPTGKIHKNLNTNNKILLNWSLVLNRPFESEINGIQHARHRLNRLKYTVCRSLGTVDEHQLPRAGRREAGCLRCYSVAYACAGPYRR